MSLSPHYFIDDDNLKLRGITSSEYLERIFKVLTVSREEVFQKILKPKLGGSFDVLDYGCGPGFLAKATAPHVNRMYAVDISDGALAAAQIVNAADNIEYLLATDSGLAAIPDESIDAVYSFAVVQHVTDDVLNIILDNCYKKLKPGGRLIIHVQLPDASWRTQEDWQSDRSFKGKLKYKYGLHCFARTDEEYSEILTEHNFGNVEIERIEDFVPEKREELHTQRLLTATKIG